MTRFGSELLTSEFPGDDGTADPELMRLLLFHVTQPDVRRQALLDKLAQTRLLVPVVAVVTERDKNGSDKGSEIAAVTFVSRDGRRGQPAFTGLATLREWDPTARPVLQKAPLVARAALEAGLDAVLLDLGSGHRFAVSGEELAWLARQ